MIQLVRIIQQYLQSHNSDPHQANLSQFIYCVRKLVSCITHRFLLLLIRRDESQPLVLLLKTLTSIKKLCETRGMTYELLLEKIFFSMEILHSLLYRNWSVNSRLKSSRRFLLLKNNKFHISKLCQQQWFDRAICCAKSLKAFASQSLPNAKSLNFDHRKKH